MHIDSTSTYGISIMPKITNSPSIGQEDFRKYFETKMLDDALLRSYVTPEIVRESSNYVEAIAFSMGVEKEQIAVPTPYMVSRLAMIFAYMTTAQRKAMFSKGETVDNDSFALKYRMYRELLNDILKQITPNTFTNGKIAKRRSFPFTAPLSRN